MVRRSSKKNVRIEDVVKVNILGAGWQGTVWSVRHGDSLYALKERLVTGKDAKMKDTKSSSVLRELEFYGDIANRYPLFFSKLYDWKITPATEETKKEFLRSGKVKSGEISSLDKYTYVFTTLSAMKDGTLNSVYKTLNQKQWLSLLAQVCYAISLLHERGFSHGDIWEANIAFEKVPWDQSVSVYRTKVPCFGFVWSIIDYGAVALDKDRSRDEKHGKRANSFDLDDMIVLVSGQHDATKSCGTRYEDLEKKSFKDAVLSSVDGPSVKSIMKQTGLPLDLALAILSLDGYIWHVCGKMRTCETKTFIDRGLLLKMADARASYANLAITFAKLARD